ncbi:MAG: hypothetical protein J6Y02_15300 [Pseudobutyrivibrio sp.]|nr:hypothetical protein [Pseudobutyrivibrio sp.]
MAINMNSLPTEKPSMSSVIPKGCYIAKIVKAEMKTPKSGKADYFSAECDITDPVSNTGMGKFWINLFESNANLPRYQLARFIRALNLDIVGEFELKDLTKMVNNKSLMVDICPDKDNERSIVDISADCFYPIELSTRDSVEAEINEVFTAPIGNPSEQVPSRAASY